MRSIKVGLPVCLVAPLVAVAAVSLLTTSRSGGVSVWDLALVGLIMWWILAVLILVPAVPRVIITRRWKRWALDEREGIWRLRQRTVALDGFKLFLALIAILGLLSWVEGLFDIDAPGEHDVVVVVPQKTEFVTAYVARPRVTECPETTTLVIKTDGGPSRSEVTVGTKDIRASSRSQYEEEFRIPMAWDRTWTSCYYEFPEFRTHGELLPVNLYLYGVSNATGSVPEPTRAVNGYWGWRCPATRKGNGCAVMAVMNSDPEATSIAVVLLIVGSVVAGIFTLVGSVLLSLWRGWIDDFTTMGRLAWARARRLRAKKLRS